MAKLKKKRSILIKFRNYFFAGIVVLIPLAITLYFTLFLSLINANVIQENMIHAEMQTSKGIILLNLEFEMFQCNCFDFCADEIIIV